MKRWFIVSKCQDGKTLPFVELLSILKRYDPNFIHSSIDNLNNEIYFDTFSGALGCDCLFLYLDEIEQENVEYFSVHAGYGNQWDELIFELLDKYGFEYHGDSTRYVHGPDSIYKNGHWYVKIKTSSEVSQIPSDLRYEWKIRKFARKTSYLYYKSSLCYRALPSETRLFLWGMILLIPTFYLVFWLAHH